MYNKGLETDFLFHSLYSHKKSQYQTVFQSANVILPLKLLRHCNFSLPIISATLFPAIEIVYFMNALNFGFWRPRNLNVEYLRSVSGVAG